MEFEGPVVATKKPESDRGVKESPERAAWRELVSLTDARSESIDQDVIGRMKKLYPDFNFERFKPEIESFEHGQLDIKFVGVHHVVETLAAHRAVIEAAIADADIVVLEAAIDTSGAALDSKNLHEKQFRPVESDRSVSMNFPNYELNTNSATAFFAETENMARKYKKQVVLLDPYSDRRFLQSAAAVQVQGGISHTDRLNKLNQQIRGYSEAVSSIGDIGSNIALAAGSVEVAYREIAPVLLRDKEESARTTEERQYGRRGFLKRGAAYTASIALGIGAMEAAGKNIAAIDSRNDREQVKTTQYNQIDFRDVAIATGLEKLSQSFSKKMKVAIVYGSYHQTGVRQYLENPNERQAKLALYKPFRDIAPPEMAAYQYEINPEVVSGGVKLQDIPEKEWGSWKEKVRASL